MSKHLMDPKQRIQLASKMMGRKLYEYQEKFLLAGNDPSIKGRIALKGRQTGFSTIMCVEAAIDFQYFNNYLVLFVSKKESYAAELLDRTRTYLRALGHSYYKDNVVTDNDTELSWSNGSRILALSQEPSNARGFTANMAYVDEIAFLQWQMELMEALSPALVREGRICLVSTPNGRGDLFHNTWERREELGYWSIEVPWHKCPDLSPSYMEKERERLKTTRKSFSQEYECSFDVKADAAVTWDFLKGLIKSPTTDGGTRVLGWDPAKTKHGSGVCILQAEDKYKEVIHLEDLKGSDFKAQSERIMELVEVFNVSKVYVDDWGIGSPIGDYLSPIKHKLNRMHLKKDDKLNLYHYMVSEGEANRFSIRELPLTSALLGQLYDFDTRTGKFPDKGDEHGDLGMSVILAWNYVPRSVKVQARDISAQIRGFSSSSHHNNDPGQWFQSREQ